VGLSARIRAFTWPLTGIAALLLAAACSSTPGAAPASTEPAQQAALEEQLPIKGPRTENGYQAILGTPDLGVGTNRIGVLLTSPRGFVKASMVEFTSWYVADGPAQGPAATARAEFHQWPYTVSRGLYVAELDFDRPGLWRIEAEVPSDGGGVEIVRVEFEVRPEPLAPAVGDKAPASVTMTAADVGRLSQLTTGSLQDPDLYRISLADAVASGLPTVVVFASPAFCITEVCGPQVEVLQELKNKYKGRANFVHVDFYSNPEEIQGDLGNAVVSPAVVEWRLPSIEWTFVIDANGVITGRFEAFATVEELDAALSKVF